MRDFSLDIYRALLETLQAKGYRLISFADYFKDSLSDMPVYVSKDLRSKIKERMK